MKINYLLFNTKAIMDKMLEEFKGSSNYADRITFIDFCSHMQQNFSRSFCRENKLLSGLDLVTDKVPNMRIKLAKSLLYFRCMIDDDDEEQEEALNNIEKIINKLLNNLDKDVKEVVNFLFFKLFLKKQKDILLTLNNVLCHLEFFFNRIFKIALNNLRFTSFY